MKHRLWTLVLVLFLPAVPGICQDVVHLKNGATLEGAVVADDGKSITLRLGDGTVDLSKDLIQDIVRGKKDAKQERQKALLTLSRFPDQETWHFLYRKGKRVGYRHIALERDILDGIPVYALTDRVVFLPDPGQPPEAECVVHEYVDAGLRPLGVSCRRSSGTSSWTLEACREGDNLVVEETAAGRSTTRTALFRPDVALWGMWIRSMCGQPVPEGGYPPLTLFDPARATFKTVEVSRRLDRINVRGKATDVLIFRRVSGDECLETWVDMAGKVIREEIATPYLVSMRVREAEIMAYTRGEVPQKDGDLGLEFISEESGLRILRPDTAWEVDVPLQERGRVVSFLRPGLRATVDVFRQEALAAGDTLEGVCLRLFGRMEVGCESFKAEGPFEAVVGDREGLRFKVVGRRRKEELTTLGAVLKIRDEAFVILCAAPTTRYEEALPAFKEVLDSVRIEPPVRAQEIEFDPFEGLPVLEKKDGPPQGGG